MVHYVFTFHALFQDIQWHSLHILQIRDNHHVHSPDALNQSDSRSARTYIIMIITGFIRKSIQISEILLLLAISASSCIRSDMQTSLNLSMS